MSEAPSPGDLVEFEVDDGDSTRSITGTVDGDHASDGYVIVRTLVFNDDGSCSVGQTTVAASRCRVLSRGSDRRNR